MTAAALAASAAETRWWRDRFPLVIEAHERAAQAEIFPELAAAAADQEDDAPAPDPRELWVCSGCAGDVKPSDAIEVPGLPGWVFCDWLCYGMNRPDRGA